MNEATTAIDRMREDVQWLYIAAAENADGDPWVPSSILDLASSHIAQIHRLEKSAANYVVQANEFAFIRELATEYSQFAVERFGAPAFDLGDFLTETPLPRECEMQLAQLKQLRASVRDALDSGDEEPHINTVKKFLRAIARVEKQLETSLMAAGIYMDEAALERLKDGFMERIINWSTKEANISFDDWCVMVEALTPFDTIPPN